MSPNDIPASSGGKVEPYVGDAIRSISKMTMEGRQWVAQLYSNVFSIENRRQHMGSAIDRQVVPRHREK